MIDLEHNEHILYEGKKHWFLLFTEFFMLGITAFVPLVCFGLLILTSVRESLSAPVLLLFVFGYTVWLLFLWILVFVFWTDYHLDVWIVTNKKLIDIEQQGVFNRQISTLNLGRIQDVTVSFSGVIQTLLNFGDVHVQTAGSETEFIISGVTRPEELKRVIIESSARISDSN